MDTTDITTTILQNIRNDVARINAKLDDNVARIDGKFANIDDKFAKIDDKFANIDDKLANIDNRFEKLEAKLDARIDELRNELKCYATREQLNSAVSLLDQRIDRVYMKVVENDVRQQDMQRTLDRMMYMLEARSTLEGRMDRCELDIIDLKQRVL